MRIAVEKKRELSSDPVGKINWQSISNIYHCSAPRHRTHRPLQMHLGLADYKDSVRFDAMAVCWAAFVVQFRCSSCLSAHDQTLAQSSAFEERTAARG